MQSSSSSSLSLLRYQQFLIVGIVLIAIWYASVMTMMMQQQIQQQQQQQPQQQFYYNLVLYAPIWFVIGIGMYAIVSVVYGTFTFHDTPEAAKELEQQIQQAKQDMIRRGIIIVEENNQKEE